MYLLLFLRVKCLKSIPVLVVCSIIATERYKLFQAAITISSIISPLIVGPPEYMRENGPMH